MKDLKLFLQPMLGLGMAAMLGCGAAPPAVDQQAGDAKETMTVSVPGFSQIVAFKVPKGWKRAHENNKPGHYLMEFIPEEQSLQNWREMITVQGFLGLASYPNANTRLLMNMLDMDIQLKCQKHFIRRDFGDRKIDGASATVALLGCGKFPKEQPWGAKTGESEVAIYVFLKGSNDMYVIHKSQRGEANAPDASLLSRGLDQWLSPLQPIKLCEHFEPQTQCWERRQR